MTNIPPVVRFTAVHKSFGAVRAVTGLDLQMSRGETVALLGRNGAGKSTALGLLLGLGNGYGLTGQTTGVANTACMTGLSVAGGLWIPADAFPRWLAAVSRWTPTARFGDLGWSVLDHRAPSAGTAAVLTGWLPVFAGYAVLSYRRSARTA
jgi:hypothetical protein